jgi:7-cyano-7-deazaguanine synthase in queuosine biosynthesis
MNYAPSRTPKSNKSDRNNYTLNFKPVLNSNGSVEFIDHCENKILTVSFGVDDQDFQYRVRAEFPSIIADIVDLAVAIHVSDRLAFHDLNKKLRHLNIVLPVRHPELLRTEPFYTKLQDLLEWATGSKWVFDFQKRTVSERSVEQQSVLLSTVPEGCEVALWSGGLDALAGLYTRLQTRHTAPFMLFGTGSSKSVYARQEKVFQAIRQSFPTRLHLCRVPINFVNTKLLRKNKVTRARGVVFTLLGAACAYLMGQRTLYVYENGMGAINLPYRASAVGLDHSRSVHPLTLLKVSDVVSELLGEEFRVHNPFLFWTKAEMCRALAENQENDLAAITQSCDRRHRKPQQPIQCGYCSSCILRKQALAASKLEDKTRYVVPHGDPPVSDPREHLLNMLAQVDTFRALLTSSNKIDLQWEALTREFPILDDIVDRSAGVENLSPAEMRSRLIKLYQSYITEWDIAKSQITTGILNKSSNQQTSDRRLTEATHA